MPVADLFVFIVKIFSGCQRLARCSTYRRQHKVEEDEERSLITVASEGNLDVD